MYSEPSFLRLSVAEVQQLARGGGANGWSVGRVREALEHPALTDFYVYLDHDVERGYKPVIRYLTGATASVLSGRCLAHTAVPAEVSATDFCACLVMWGVRGDEAFEITTSFLWVSPDGRIQRSIGFPDPCAEVSQEHRDRMSYNVDNFFSVLVGLQLAITHTAAAPFMCGRRRPRFCVPMPRGASRAPGRVRIYKLGVPSGDLAGALRALPPEPVPRVRHCPAWGVRGHYRRLRSGRTVYVRPCVKGPERLAASVPGREYSLS